MSIEQNRGGAVLFGGIAGGGTGDVSISGPPVVVNSITRFASVDGKNVKGSGNQLTFDGTLFAVRDVSDELVFGVDVDTKALSFNLAAANPVSVSYVEPHLNFAFAGVDAAISISHTDPDQDLFFEVFESGQPADANNSSLQMGWDDLRGSFVLQTLQSGTGVLRGIDMLAPSVTVNTPAPDVSAVFEASSSTQGFLAPRMTTVQRDAISTPAAGLLVYNTTTSEYNFFDGVAWQSFADGSAPLKFSNFFQEDNAVETVLSAANVFVNINCLLTGALLEDFTVSGSTITYIGVAAIDVEISFSISIDPAGNRKDEFRSRIFKNGTTALSGQGRTRNKPNDSLTASIQTLVLFAVASLVTNDTLDVQVANGTNGTNVTVQEISGIIREIR